MSHVVSPISVTTAGVLFSGPVTLAGFSFLNTSANVGVFRIYDNATTNSGTILWSGSFAANTGGSSVIFPGSGIHASNGLYLSISNSATVEGSILIS